MTLHISCYLIYENVLRTNNKNGMIQLQYTTNNDKVWKNTTILLKKLLQYLKKYLCVLLNREPITKSFWQHYYGYSHLFYDK